MHARLNATTHTMAHRYLRNFCNLLLCFTIDYEGGHFCHSENGDSADEGKRQNNSFSSALGAESTQREIAEQRQVSAGSIKVPKIKEILKIFLPEVWKESWN